MNRIKDISKYMITCITITFMNALIKYLQIQEVLGLFLNHFTSVCMQLDMRFVKILLIIIAKYNKVLMMTFMNTCMYPF